MNNIDILEELKPEKMDLIQLIRTFKREGIENFITIRREKFETLIAENKELKEEKEELKRENLEIRDWKYVIDSPIDLDKLKELDLIKIKGKEYISKSIYNELEKDKKALINNYSKILGEFIPKSKVEEEIDKLNKKEKDLQNSINDEEREEYSDANISFDLMDIDIRRETLQSLLEKE